MVSTKPARVPVAFKGNPGYLLAFRDDDDGSIRKRAVRPLGTKLDESPLLVRGARAIPLRDRREVVAWRYGDLMAYQVPKPPLPILLEGNEKRAAPPPMSRGLTIMPSSSIAPWDFETSVPVALPKDQSSLSAFAMTAWSSATTP